MQIDHIRAFLMLCEEKNITRCSERLHISQQGLSKQIKAMEQELGVQLFSRSNTGIIPTEEAIALLPDFEKTVVDYEHGLEALRNYQKSHRTILRVAVCPGIIQALGLEFFQEFQKENPDIQLKIVFQSDLECENALQQEKVDAAFLDWPVHETEYDRYLVVRSRLVAVMSKEHPLSKKSSVSIREFAGTNIYVPDESHRMSQRFAEYYPELYQSVVMDFTTNEYDSFYRELPKQGDGAALTFRYLCTNLDPSLTVVDIQEDSHLELSYCVRKENMKNHALDKFTEFVHQNAKVIIE